MQNENKNSIGRIGLTGLIFAWLLWFAHGCEESYAQFSSFGNQTITSGGQAFSNAVVGHLTSQGQAFSNTPPQRIMIVTNQVVTYWVTNGAGGGLFYLSAGLSTNLMTVYTNINGGTFQTNYYLVYNEQSWRQFFHSRTLTNVWDEGTNFPDTTWANPFVTTNGSLPAQWWLPGVWNAATLNVSNYTVNYYTNIP